MEQQKVATTIYTLNVLSELIRNCGVISVGSVPDNSVVDTVVRQQEQVPNVSTYYALDSFLGLPLNYGTVSVVGDPDAPLAKSEERQHSPVPDITVDHNLENISEWLLSYRNASVLPGHSLFDDWFADFEKVEQNLGAMRVYFFSSQGLQEIGVPPAPPAGGVFVGPDEMGQLTMTSIRTFEIEDPTFEETYTAYVKKDTIRWTGWIPHILEEEYTAKTEEDLREILADKLHEALVAEQEAWEKQLEEDAENGFLDHLSEKAVQNYQAGRYYDLETLKKK